MAQSSAINFGFPDGAALLITGAASGIGRATAIQAAKMGLRLSIWDVNGDGLAETVRMIEDALAATAQQGCTRQATAQPTSELPGAAPQVHTWIGDLTDYAVIDDGIASATQALGEILYLHNNAGPASSADLEFDAAVTICVGSMRAMTEAWAKTKPGAGAERGKGAAMVLTTSVAGNEVGSDKAWYSTSKAALMGYTRHLSTQRTGEFRSNAVAPGMTDTPRLAGFADSDVGKFMLQMIPMRRMATPDDIAFATLFLLSPLASYINGAFLPVDGGWTNT